MNILREICIVIGAIVISTGLVSLLVFIISLSIDYTIMKTRYGKDFFRYCVWKHRNDK